MAQANDVHRDPRKPRSQRVTDALRQVKVTNTNHSSNCRQNGNDLHIRKSFKQPSATTHAGYGNFRRTSEEMHATTHP